MIQLQMVDESIGYILGTRDTNPGNVDVFKTEDGGQSWKDTKVMVSLHPGPGIRGVAENMHFITADIGMVSYKIGDKMNLLKTTTGGENWRQYIFEDRVGSIKRIQADVVGNLYALLSDENNNATLLKSYDQELSWKTLDVAQSFYFFPFPFSFHLSGNKLYVSGFGASVIELDTAGHFLREINTNYSTLRELAVVDENSFLATSNGISLSIDGGESWQEINDTYPYLIGVNSPSEFLMIFSETPGPVADDVFAVTSDGGNTWQESQEVYTRIGADFVNSQKIADNQLPNAHWPGTVRDKRALVLH